MSYTNSKLCDLEIDLGITASGGYAKVCLRWRGKPDLATYGRISLAFGVTICEGTLQQQPSQ